jgi:flagellar biosynthetic protein FliR
MMAMPTEVWLAEWVRWLTAAARFGGALALMPALSVPQVPSVCRAVVAFGAALAGLPFVPPVTTDAPFLLLVVLVREAVIGMLIGMVFASFVWLWEWVGELADWQVGFGFAALADPIMGARIAIIARIAMLLAGILFFQLGGHHLLLRAVAESYRWLPVTSDFALRPQLGEAWWTMLGRGFFLALPLIVPTLGIVLLTDLVLGLMGRAAPQLGVLLWGMPARILACLFVTAIALTAMPNLAERLLAHLTTSVPTLLATLAGR